MRHFSMKVCEKVQKKGITTYNEVVDELVSELSDMQSGFSDIVSGHVVIFAVIFMFKVCTAIVFQFIITIHRQYLGFSQITNEKYYANIMLCFSFTVLVFLLLCILLAP